MKIPNKTSAQIARFFSFFLFSFFSFSGFVLSAEPPNPGASADVLNARVSRKAREQLEYKKEPVSVGIEEQKSDVGLDIDSRAFLVKKITLTGDLLVAESEYLPVVQKYEGRELTLRDLKLLMDELEMIFRADGFLAVATLPPQKVRAQEVQIEMVVSKLGQVSVEGQNWFNEKLVLRHWQLNSGDYLKYEDLRQAALKMSQNPDRAVRPILKAGKEKRTTDVVLKVEDHFPVHADFSFDNQGVKLTGKKRFGAVLRHNNFLGFDDTFLIGTSFGSRFGALFLNYSLPINRYGTYWTANFSHAQVNPKKEFDNLGINSLSQTYGTGLRQDLFQNERISSSVIANFNFKEKKTRVLSATTTWDKLRVIEFGSPLQTRDRWGMTFFDPSVSWGMPNRGDGYPLASRKGEHSFTKYHLNFSRHLKMPWKTFFLAKGEAQLTPDRLLPQEQLFLGGADSVRGYPESDYGADQGYVLQMEYFMPVPFLNESWFLPGDQVALRDRLKILGFFDQGYGRVRDPQNGEVRSSFLAGTGFGVDFAFRDNLSLRVEWGIRLGDRPATESGDEQLHFRLRSGI